MLSSYPLPSIIVIPYEVQKKILLEYWLDIRSWLRNNFQTQWSPMKPSKQGSHNTIGSYEPAHMIIHLICVQ
jgi:hypothetical protein